MATASLTNVDTRARDAVMRQLEWDPEVDASATAKSDTVTLTGYSTRIRASSRLNERPNGSAACVVSPTTSRSA